MVDLEVMVDLEEEEVEEEVLPMIMEGVMMVMEAMVEMAILEEAVVDVKITRQMQMLVQVEWVLAVYLLQVMEIVKELKVEADSLEIILEEVEVEMKIILKVQEVEVEQVLFLVQVVLEELVNIWEIQMILVLVQLETVVVVEATLVMTLEGVEVATVLLEVEEKKIVVPIILQVVMGVE